MAMTSSDSPSCNLLHKTDYIRNVCILAHVDHGKTTFADVLIASNKIISSRLAGTLRYMDSLEDEQERGITMKSSSIALYHKYEGNEYLINLMDSPGHVDFSLEVSTAVRLCDGALLVIDVVEGVCPQTLGALRHAWAEKLKTVLVLNKLDRLILEKKMNPLTAYHHIVQILEQVNSVMASLLRGDVMVENEVPLRRNENSDNTFSDWSNGCEGIDDSRFYFSPEDGNVIFASAIDSWGFSIEDFTEILSHKCGFSKTVLQKTLWGNYYLDLKSNQVKKGAQEHTKKPLFVKLVLENIWTLYETINTCKDKDKIMCIVEKLKINVKPQQLRFNDSSQVSRTILGSWLPLASTVMNSVCKILPPPNRLSEEKIDNLLFGSRKYVEPCEETMNLRSAFFSCSSNAEAPIIVFVSKMVPIRREHLPQNRVKLLPAQKSRNQDREQEVLSKEEKNKSDIKAEQESEPGEVFVAFARIYSGCIRVGSTVYVLGPKHDPRLALQKLKQGYKIAENITLKDLKANEHITRVTIESLYLLMGRELLRVNEIPAGNVFGIGGLEDHVLNHATLCTEIACPPFSEFNLMATPILRVAVEPQNPGELRQLLCGLKLLNQADASVQVLSQQTGEQILVTTGEVHLQRCIKDLRERYAKVPVLVSEPIIPFRETVIPSPKVDDDGEVIVTKTRRSRKKSDEVSVSTSNNQCSICIKAFPLPETVVMLLENNANLVKYLASNVGKKNETVVTEFKAKLARVLASNNLCVEDVWSFGPKMCGPNILFNTVENAEARMSFWTKADAENVYTKFESSFVNGFQLASLAGPLCEEPMMGVGFAVSDWRILEDVHDFKQFSGQLVLAVKEGCWEAFQQQPQRLMAAMYSCNILVNTEALGRMYALLNKRHGRVLHGDLEASSETTFNITAYLPVAESFAFASEVRKQTSGLANPQLVFSHWEVINVDPFEEADSAENYARTCMNRVRKRKGFATDEKVIEHAEKQRTLSKKK